MCRLSGLAWANKSTFDKVLHKSINTSEAYIVLGREVINCEQLVS